MRLLADVYSKKLLQEALDPVNTVDLEAPIAPHDGRVLWQEASLIDPERLDIRAVPDPERATHISVTPEALVQNAAADGLVEQKQPEQVAAGGASASHLGLKGQLAPVRCPGRRR